MINSIETTVEHLLRGAVAEHPLDICTRAHGEARAGMTFLTRRWALETDLRCHWVRVAARFVVLGMPEPGIRVSYHEPGHLQRAFEIRSASRLLGSLSGTSRGAYLPLVQEAPFGLTSYRPSQYRAPPSEADHLRVWMIAGVKG